MPKFRNSGCPGPRALTFPGPSPAASPSSSSPQGRRAAASHRVRGLGAPRAAPPPRKYALPAGGRGGGMSGQNLKRLALALVALVAIWLGLSLVRGSGGDAGGVFRLTRVDPATIT